jgi:hypothetical protein
MVPNGRWLVVSLLIALSGCGPSGLPATPLFVGVTGDSYAQGSRVIQARLDARFPTGSSVRDLKDYLEQQGLEVEPTARSSTQNSGAASFEYGGPLCGSRVRVVWESDGAGKIKRIDVVYGDTGCP